MLEMKYFVLKPKGKDDGDLWALASREAMMTFARVIRPLDPACADELEAWVAREVESDVGRQFCPDPGC